MNSTATSPRRQWIRLAARIARRWRSSGRVSDQLVNDSYDAIAAGYDNAWTSHMRDLSLRMLDGIDVPAGARCLDLTCGTGFVTAELARRSGTTATGVDRSDGMIQAARAHHGETCEFVLSDIVEFLTVQSADRYDVITCAWGLGYSRPWRVVRAAARCLRPGGRLGVIDNTMFSLAEVMTCATLAFAERPAALRHVLHPRFLPHSSAAAMMLRLAGLRVRSRADGARPYHVETGEQAVGRLIATGAAAGFEHACEPDLRDDLIARFAAIADRRLRDERGVRITHRWLMVIGDKR